jgi:GTPase
MSAPFHCGLATLAGRPNVGKSTLLNRLVGEKLSITSRRAQTTRDRTLGIRTLPDAQLVFVDTPGLHAAEGRPLNRYMNRIARSSLQGIDCIVLVITADGWHDGDQYALEQVASLAQPVILAVNMIDRLDDRAQLLPLIEESGRKMNFAAIVPLSARRGDNVDALEREIVRLLPEQPPMFPADQITDRSERFLAAELVREQIFRGFGQEIPYASAVKIDQFKRARGKLNVAATIFVEKEGQKAILIGARGERLKQVGTQARLAMEKLFGARVHLSLWVKVREGWADDARSLKSFGYGGDE